MSKQEPAWLPEAQQFCRNSGIKIVGWGPDTLTVEAKSEDRAKEIASQLGQLGFKAIKNEDNTLHQERVVSQKSGTGRGNLTMMPALFG